MFAITVAPDGAGLLGAGAGLAGAGAGAGLELAEPEFEAGAGTLGLDAELLFEVVVVPAFTDVALKGFADPDPQPTMEAAATRAALNFNKTLDDLCTFYPVTSGIATD
jgi:hypothetical protein